MDRARRGRGLRRARSGAGAAGILAGSQRGGPAAPLPGGTRLPCDRALRPGIWSPGAVGRVTMAALFLSSVTVIAYTFFGYPALIAAWARLWPRPVRVDP